MNRYLLYFFLFISTFPGTESLAKDITLKIDNLSRTVRISTPSFSENEKLPVIIVLHGLGDTAKWMAGRTPFESFALKKGYLIAFANGYEGSWNAGSCCATALLEQTNDVQFILALLEYLKNNYSIDEGKVNLAGVSNGGSLVFSILKEAGRLFDRAFILNGQFYPAQKGKYSGGTSLLIVGPSEYHGVPYLGAFGISKIGSLGQNAITITPEESLAYLAEVNECGDSRDIIQHGSIRSTYLRDCSLGSTLTQHLTLHGKPSYATTIRNGNTVIEEFFNFLNGDADISQAN